MIKRRSFLTFFSVGWAASCFPVVLAACAPNKSTTQATASTESLITAEDPAIVADKGSKKTKAKSATAGFTVVGSVADLDKGGYLQTKQVAITRDATNPKNLIAVSPKCTHQGCDVRWMADEKKYNCPCHSAEYAADGKVLKGPATKSLPSYQAKIVGTQVLVKI
jgi:cytochrome b6-f complex iron-sulfur subunit